MDHAISDVHDMLCVDTDYLICCIKNYHFLIHCSPPEHTEQKRKSIQGFRSMGKMVQINDLNCNIIQMCSGITQGKVLNGELYARRFQKSVYLHLFTDCFMKISPQMSEQTRLKSL